ncbi:bromodomain and WD repeat-containing protein 3 [Zeugodacus cucurbitae]|uniref:bromodomain and WD repeat-containing protein 3 n=1 Tax=Zeugodacus cucurbitae TaxID=28588 RepID=UPI0023D8FD30|nr:bromodomain and WD repeat-containing protein 3 [Zeugodacus cucurbitae]
MESNKQLIAERIVTPELYFLISKFLASGPLKETAEVLVRELEQKKVLPRRTDWLGHEHEQSFAELEQKYAHIGSNHLLEICCRIGPILDKDLPPAVLGIISLLGTGRQSLLRTEESIYRSRSLLDYCTRLHGVSLPDSSVTKPIHNLQKVLIGREYGGPVRRKLLVPISLYNKTKLLKRTVGHLSSVYCVLFDRTGRYIITGADDLLIKIWSAMDGRLLATLRGASAEITDIAINLDNTMLAAGSLDRILRVWDMQTTSPIAVLSGHTGMITSVNFCPSPRGDLKYLVTTSTDGSIAFWQYSTPRGQKITFAPKPIQYHEKLRPGQAQMMCTTFSPGGIFLAAGSADHHVRVYIMSEDGPKRILESEAYTDAVDSVQWSHRGLRFISGSKDGTAHIWNFESQQWKSTKLSMTDRLPSCPPPEEGKKLKVTMVAWDCSDKYVITAVNDFTIKIWHSKTGKLHRVLRGHKDELYVLESNPKDEHVLLSAGHDGQVFLWDIESGIAIADFMNDIDGQGHGGVFDAKWSPDGTMFAATDSHGHLLIYGLGIGPDKYKILPNELFFHTDYRPLMRDASQYVVDEQTQVMPHLMPPPFLVNSEGNPYPVQYQRFVPGRENCTREQLRQILTVGDDGTVIVPNINGAAGNFSHIDRLIAVLANRQGTAPVPPAMAVGNNLPANHSQLDRLIEALANRQGQDQAPDSNNRPSSNRSAAGVVGNARYSFDDMPGRQIDPNSTPRQSSGSITTPDEHQLVPTVDQPAQPSQTKYFRRIYVRPMKYQQLQNLKQTVYAAGQFELQEYKREMRRRPIMINTGNVASAQSSANRQRNTRGNNDVGGAVRSRRRQGQSSQSQPAYRTRAVRDQEELDAPQQPEEEEEDEESNSSSGDTSYSNVEENLEESSDDSDTESSDYSDWVADTPGPNLEPPKRSKRKPLSRRRTFSDDSSDETTEQATTSGGAAAKTSRRNKRVVIPPPAPNGEIPELYRPAEWLSEVIPRKAPYYPQMGDEVVYFRQGHQRYLEAVRVKKVYKLTHSSEPWNFRTLRDREFVRVIGIKYEIRPPRLCCLKLAMIDDEGNMTGTSFKIKYHDMPDVLDFLVLRQTFDLAVQRNWSVGDRFRCMIGDGWWMGQIESRYALSTDFPDSYFMCFRVRWDNGEYEYMSPWDMEPIDENRLPDEVGGAVPVLQEEIRATLYQPKSEEWHRGDRDGSCRRIINGLEQVMRLSIAEHFLAPVDLNVYPDYAYLIEYPIDLTTIKSRFENHFYRRITSAQFDVRYLATNAEKYNRSHTNIVKHARIITDLCLRVIRESNDIDVAAVYHQLVDVYHSSETENDNESDVVPSTSTGPSTSAAGRPKISATRRSSRIRSDGDWRTECRQLLDLMWQRNDSLPFREPVDTLEFPDYLEIISSPMDLRTVKEDLLGGNYEDPLDFAKDVRLIFQNSRNYNTNKRSQIYAMTLRLSALFESQIKTVINNWKAARRRANKTSGSGGRGSSSSPVKRQPPQAAKRARTHRTTRQFRSSDDDDDDDDDDDEEPGRAHLNARAAQRRAGGATTNGRNGLHRGTVSAVASTSAGSNRVSSSSSLQRRAGEPTQATRSSRRKAASQELDDDDDEDEEEDAEIHVTDEHSTASSSTSEEDSDSDDSSEVGLNDSNEGSDNETGRGKRGAARRRKRRSDDDDSEDSYKPDNDRRGSRRSNGRKRGRKNKAAKKTSRKQQDKRQQATRKRRRRIEEDGDEDYMDHSEKRSATAMTNGSTRHTAVTNGNVRRGNRRRLQSSEDDHTDMMAHHTSSQPDESTQDTITGHPATGMSTPKKRAATSVRSQRSNQASNAVGENDATTSAGALLQQSPSRNTRMQTNSSQSSGLGTLTNRRSATEIDHSYHLPVRNGRIADSDTDSREVAANARPTRSSFKRAILEWARTSDVEDAEQEAVDEEDSEDAEEILPTPTPTKITPSKTNNASNSNPLNAPSTSRAAHGGTVVPVAVGQVRQLRTNRNTVVEPLDDNEDSDDGDGSENEPLVSSQGGAINGRIPPVSYPPTRSATNTATPRLQAHAAAMSNAHMTRSHATSTTSSSNVTTSTLSAHDHNYLGAEALGPSTSAAAGRSNTRRVLSRHQRNADELDSSADPLENISLLMQNQRLRRTLPTSTSTSQSATNGGTITATAPTRVPQRTVRRGRSRYSQENSQTAEDDDDDDDEHVVDGSGEENASGASDEGTDGGSSTHDDDDDVDATDDSEDNQPLTSYVPSGRRTRNHAKPARRTNRRRGSDDSFVCDDDDEDYEVEHQRRQQQQQRSRSRRHSERDRNGAQRDGRNQRGSRNQKRPRYNEQSDDEAGSHDYSSSRKRRREGDDGGGVVGEVVGSSSQRAMSQRPSRNVEYMDSSEDDDDDEQLVSVSSRGRVRKISAKARGIFKD